MLRVCFTVKAQIQNCGKPIRQALLGEGRLDASRADFTTYSLSYQFLWF
jgi:hypothetical protein